MCSVFSRLKKTESKRSNCKHNNNTENGHAHGAARRQNGKHRNAHTPKNRNTHNTDRQPDQPHISTSYLLTPPHERRGRNPVLAPRHINNKAHCVLYCDRTNVQVTAFGCLLRVHSRRARTADSSTSDVAWRLPSARPEEPGSCAVEELGPSDP